MGHIGVRWRPNGISKTVRKQQFSLSQQYGGIHAGGWVNLLPAYWVPYVQLCRLSPPAGLSLIYFPPIFGVLHSASVHGSPTEEVLRACLILLAASFFGNNAAHAWNDLVDAPIDARIERTKQRPIPRGDISPQAACIFAASQLLCLALTLVFFLPMDAALAAVPPVVVTVYYPYAKRHTYFPQVVLGFCLTWSIMVGSMSMGVAKAQTDPSTLLLLAASVQWVVIFDTIYAHQDLVDDLKVGVKSTAVFFRSWAKVMLWTLFLGMNTALLASGYFGHMGPAYYLLAVGGCVVSVGTMIASVDLKDPASCWAWFSQGFWLTGLTIAGGLLAEYAIKSGWDAATMLVA